jgi:hypothetical protein
VSKYKPKFTYDDAYKANRDWGCNCGPTSVASIYGLTLAELRPHLQDFEQKKYTSPSMMWSILGSLGKPWNHRKPLDWPTWGLVRIQWHGPWMADGVPIKARYWHTHWVGASRANGKIGVWDVNALDDDTGWLSLDRWANEIVPHLTAHTPRADGKWSITHSIEVTPPTAEESSADRTMK